MSRRITALTKEGIKSIQNGRFTDAILCFRHALQCLKEAESVHHAPPGLQVEDESNELPLETIDIFHSKSNVHRARSPHNVFDIYAAAFMFPRTKDVVDVQFEMSIVICTNLALAHHLAGLHLAENSMKHLQEALRYYKLSLTLFRSRACLCFDNWYALVLGVLTNMGFIFCHFWRVDEARSCSNHIDTLLSSPAVLDLSAKDGEFFFSTLTHAKDFDSMVAPAA